MKKCMFLKSHTKIYVFFTALGRSILVYILWTHDEWKNVSMESSSSGCFVCNLLYVDEFESERRNLAAKKNSNNKNILGLEFGAKIFSLWLQYFENVVPGNTWSSSKNRKMWRPLACSSHFFFFINKQPVLIMVK